MYSLDSTPRTSSDLSTPTIKTTSTIKSSSSSYSASSHTPSSRGQKEGEGEGEGEGEIRLNPSTGRPLRNTTPYGRHSNDWLFGSVRVHKSIARKVRRAVGAKTGSGSAR